MRKLKSTNPYLDVFLTQHGGNIDDFNLSEYDFEYYVNPSIYMYSSVLSPNHTLFESFEHLYKDFLWVTSFIHIIFMLGHTACAALGTYMMYTYFADHVNNMNYFLFLMSASIVSACNMGVLIYYYFNPYYYIAYYITRCRVMRLLGTLEILNLFAWVWLLVDSTLPHPYYLYSIILGGSLVVLWGLYNFGRYVLKKTHIRYLIL